VARLRSILARGDEAIDEVSKSRTLYHLPKEGFVIFINNG